MHIAKALVPIFRDLLATFVFVALFWITDNIFVATAFGMALGISQTLWTRLRGHAVGPLQWLTLVLITVFGGATILFHNAHFIMVKPTLLWLALGAVMLRRDWMAPYLPPIVTENLDDHLIVRAGNIYAALMFVLAVANLVVLWLTSPKVWVPPLFISAVCLTPFFLSQPQSSGMPTTWGLCFLAISMTAGSSVAT